MNEANKPQSGPTKITAADVPNPEIEKSRISEVTVLTEVFEGPLDLLLFLIRKNQLDIFTVSLAQITQQYLEYLQVMRELDLELAGEYLAVAGILVEYKSRALLPTSMAPPDEEEEEEPVDLHERLREYLVFKHIAEELKHQYQERQLRFTRPVARKEQDPVEQDTEPVELVDIDLFDLYTAFRKILDEIGELHPVVLSDEDFTIEEKIEEIRQALCASASRRINLTRIVREMTTKLEVITTVLALLEVVRLKLVRIQQLKSTMDVYLTAVINPEEWTEDDSANE